MAVAKSTLSKYFSLVIVGDNLAIEGVLYPWWRALDTVTMMRVIFVRSGNEEFYQLRNRTAIAEFFDYRKDRNKSTTEDSFFINCDGERMQNTLVLVITS